MQDRNFDSLADKLAHNIYGTMKGVIREAIIWDELKKILAQLPPKSLNVLDAGGGEGRIATQLARMGHQVTLCDISAEMIARATLRASEHGVSHRVQCKQVSAEAIGEHLNQPMDLILCHAVLEWVAHPLALLQQLFRLLLPGGALSLMFYNRHGLVLRNLILGNFGWLRAGMQKRKKRSLSPDYPRDPEEVQRWLQACGFTLQSRVGIRVFNDYMLQSAQASDNMADILEMERRFAAVEPYLQLARYIHVTANKPAGEKHGA